MSTTPIPNCGKDDDLYKLYWSLPTGVVLLDSRMKTLSANRKFRIYFPFYPEGPEGFCFVMPSGAGVPREKFAMVPKADFNPECSAPRPPLCLHS
jgi:hypothetical protein